MWVPTSDIRAERIDICGSGVMRVLLLIAFLLLGCQEREQSALISSAEKGMQHRCSPEQLPAMEKQFTLCQETTIFGSYCLGLAMYSQCSPPTDLPPPCTEGE